MMQIKNLNKKKCIMVWYFSHMIIGQDQKGFVV
jgi:hypothetical protein